MTIKCNYFISIECAEQSTITIKHVKYKEETFTLNKSGTINFSSFVNWDGHTFKIKSDKEIKIKSIRFSLVDNPFISKNISVSKQTINGEDIFPERTDFFKNNSTLEITAPESANFRKQFIQMVIDNSTEAVVRFLTPKMKHSINNVSMRP